MPSGRPPYSEPLDPRRHDSVASFASANTFYTVASSMSPGHEELMDTEADAVGMTDRRPEAVDTDDQQATTAHGTLGRRQPSNDTNNNNDNNNNNDDTIHLSDVSSVGATVDAQHDDDATSGQASTAGVNDLTTHTVSPALQRLSFVNFGDTTREAPSLGATVGSSVLQRTNSDSSANSTNTVVHNSGTGESATATVTAAPTDAQLPAIVPGKRPALPSPTAYAVPASHQPADTTAISHVTAATPTLSAVGSPTSVLSSAHSEGARDYFHPRTRGTNGQRPVTVVGGAEQYAPQSLGSTQPSLSHSRRTSASAYADSDRIESDQGGYNDDELDQLEELNDDGGSDSTSDTDDYGDPEERRRAHRRHRRRRLRRQRVRMRRTHSAYMADNEATTSLRRNQPQHMSMYEEGDEDYDMLSDQEMTLKARQEAINSSHPFGLPLWKPALYKKDRSVQRAAEHAVHSQPTAQTYVTFDNIIWLVCAGWWMSLVVLLSSLPLWLLPSARGYSRLLYGLAWYLAWPFGRCVERVTGDRWSNSVTDHMRNEWSALERQSRRAQVVQSVYGDLSDDETESARPEPPAAIIRRIPQTIAQLGLAGCLYYLIYATILAPMLYAMAAVCWFFVFTLPMAKLTRGLARHLRATPLSMRFRCGSSRLPNSSVLLCTHRASGLRYYKYTYDGINIFFINLMPLVLFVLFCAHILGPHINPDSAFAQPGPIFIMCLFSAIPLAYFIGMAVSSISAQSSLGMGAVINATFGSIVEVLLYSFAIMQGKAELVEGSIIGSLLCGLLLLPGLSMISGGVRRKEQKFNSKSAGVTSTMLIMSLIGAFTPTLFHQIYGTFEIRCSDCPPGVSQSDNWQCGRCVYDPMRPETDEFYQTRTKPLMYFCAILLPLAYVITLWFTLRTHVKLIYHQDQQQESANALRLSLYKRLLQHIPPLRSAPTASQASTVRVPPASAPPGPSVSATVSTVPPTHDNPASHTLNLAIPLDVMHPTQLPGHEDEGGHNKGGHDAPEWSKLKSSVVLLSCTVLFAMIAELLVETVDAVMQHVTLQEKFLGITLFAIVPNVTEFTNAIAFALYGNIALSMEIGSAYAIQVTLLQMPALVAFSVWYNWGVEPVAHHAFRLLFPTWDVVVVILSVFLLTYIYIEGKSNYFKGSILTIAYLVFVVSFYFEPPGLAQEPKLHP